MDKRIAFAILLLAGAPLQAQIARATNQLLTAPIVQDVLEVRVVPGNGKTLGMEYRVDPEEGNGFKTLAEDQAFVASQEIDLAVPDFNPLVDTITSSETLVTDENFAGVQKFLDALLGFGRVVFPNRQLDELMREENVASEDDPCAQLQSVLQELQTQTKEEGISQSEVQGWIDQGTGLDGVKDARTSIKKKSDAVAGTIQKIEALEKDLAAIARQQGEPLCDKISAASLAQIFELVRDVPQARQRLTTLKKDLDGLHKALEPFTESTKWRGSVRTTWILHKASPSFQNGKEITIAIRRTRLNVVDGTLETETLAEGARTILLRQFSRWVPEFSAAMIYSDVEYPKWGTEERDGKLVVAPVKDDTANIEGAMMLNLIRRKRDPSFMYPAFQLGISSAEDVPGLLAGIGLRFTQPTSWSLMVGGMLTWAKDLNALAPGDVVTGTAEIESDLTLQRQDLAWYVAFQYNF